MANINIYGTLVRTTESDKIVQGSQVEGGYFVCEVLPTWGSIGQLCYCSTDKKFYQYCAVEEEVDGVTTTTNRWVDAKFDSVSPRIDEEIATRQAEDEKLDKAIKEEASAREQADKALGVRIDNEENARKAADLNLQNAINNEANRVNGELATLGEMLNKETTKLDILIGNDGDKSARTIANEELASQLLSDNAEASFKTLQELAAWIEDHPEDVAAINEAIQQLQNKLNTETETRTKQLSALTKDLASEISLREAQVNGLNFSLKEEVNRAKKEEGVLETKIATVQEAFGKTLVEKADALAEKITGEEKRAAAAEKQLDQNLITAKQDVVQLIEKEGKIRKEEDEKLSQAIDGVHTGFTNADNALKQEMEKYIQEYVANFILEQEFIIDTTGLGEPKTEEENTAQ